MKLFLLFMGLLGSLSIVESKELNVRIVKITDRVEYYEIKGMNCENNDSITIVSSKEDINDPCNYTRIEVDNEYKMDLMIMSLTIGKFSVKINDNVIWENDSSYGMPVFARNLRDLYLENNYVPDAETVIKITESDSF